MSLSLYRDWMRDFDDSMRPLKLWDPHFDLDFKYDDWMSPFHHSPFFQPSLWHRNFGRPSWRNYDFDHDVQYSKDKFQVNLDVQQFRPEEIEVRVVDNCVTIEGKHREKKDKHGYVSRHFVRRYVLPNEYKADLLTSSLSSDGMLSVSAPRFDAIEYRKVIPIRNTRFSPKAIKDART